MKENEKHRAKRQAWNGAVELYDTEGLLLMGIGHLLNLSETGSLVATSVRLTEGQVVRVRMHLEYEILAEARATVTRCQIHGSKTAYGIQFNTLSHADFIDLKERLQTAA